MRQHGSSGIDFTHTPESRTTRAETSIRFSSTPNLPCSGDEVIPIHARSRLCLLLVATSVARVHEFPVRLVLLRVHDVVAVSTNGDGSGRDAFRPFEHQSPYVTHVFMTTFSDCDKISSRGGTCTGYAVRSAASLLLNVDHIGAHNTLWDSIHSALDRAGGPNQVRRRCGRHTPPRTQEKVRIRYAHNSPVK